MAFHKGHQTSPQERYYDGACLDFRIILELSGVPKQSGRVCSHGTLASIHGGLEEHDYLSIA